MNATNNATRTVKKVSKTVLPVELKEAMKTHGNGKNSVNLVVFGDNTRKVRFDNTQWDGGSKNYYYIWHFGSATMLEAFHADGTEVSPGDDWALVILSHFCGQECTPTVYVKDAVLARFFGVRMDDVQAAGMPAVIQADYIEEQAEHFPKREAKRFRQVAETIRKVTS